MSSSPDDAGIGELPPGLPSLWRTFRFGYRAEPRLLSSSLLMLLVSALPDALIALWLKLLADGVERHAASAVMLAALGLGASATLTWCLGVFFDRVQRRFRDRLSVALEAQVARLTASIAGIEHHERPELLDRLQVLRDHVFALDHLFMSLFTTLGWLLRLGISLLLLATIQPALVLLALFALPIFFTASWRPALERAIEERAAPHARLARHLFVQGTTASPGKEVRVLGLGARLMAERRAAHARWYAPVARATWHSALYHALAWAVFGAAFTAALAWVAMSAQHSAGAVLLVLVAGSRLSQYVGAVVGELGFLRGIWLDSAQRLCWLEDYAAASRASRTRPVPEQLTRGIQLHGVSFRYPGTHKLALENVSLELPAGKVVALVGENGAGKTTLVKLLCGMYAPSSGRIELDGQPLDALPVAGWRARLAGAFQDFYRFELRAQQSIGVGELQRLDERDAALHASERAGASDVIAGLAQGLDTQLGPRWDGGQELSFGQWQKLALARGLMREAPLLLALDEPTAALDAETEHALFERFSAATRGSAQRGCITLLVSHRFSTVRMADQIVVLDGARVVEVGSHDELMARRGTYAELYGIQAAAFR